MRGQRPELCRGAACGGWGSCWRRSSLGRGSATTVRVRRGHRAIQGHQGRGTGWEEGRIAWCAAVPSARPGLTKESSALFRQGGALPGALTASSGWVRGHVAGVAAQSAPPGAAGPSDRSFRQENLKHEESPSQPERPRPPLQAETTRTAASPRLLSLIVSSCLVPSVVPSLRSCAA